MEDKSATRTNHQPAPELRFIPGSDPRILNPSQAGRGGAHFLRRAALTFVSCGLFLPLVAGCSFIRGSSATSAPRFAVKVARAPLYKKGPAQVAPPDVFLTRDQGGTLLGTKLGYSHVVTDDGVEGYIAASKLRPAPPLPAPRKAAAMTGPFSRLPGIAPEPPLPALDLSDIPAAPEQPLIVPPKP